ncbi:hypothetical protein DPSP01_014484 [Paraphaeosphaeria sporulosa]
MPSSNSTPIATIVNDLGYDVDIYDVYNNSGSPQGLLTYTKLATVPSGATGQQVQTIHLASQLQAMRTGHIQALNNNYYQQFPVAVLAVSPFNDSNSFTLTSDLQQGMEESFRFIKYAQANPSSQLATSFRTALGDPTSQKTAVNKFFQGTGSFKQCTLATWSAVVSWQAQFTSAWQGTYYLYSVGDSDGHTKAPVLVATLTIGASAQDSSAVLTMAGTDNESTALVMVGDGTMQEQNAGTGNLSVALTPSWLNVTQTSQQDGKAVVNYVIGAAFSGTINGVKVAGNLNKLALPDPSDTSKSAADKSSAFQFSLASLFSLLGLLAPIGMLTYQAKAYYEAKEQKQNDKQEDAPSKDDEERQQEEIEQKYQEDDLPQVRNQAQQVELESVPQVPRAYAQVSQGRDIQIKEETVSEQMEQLNEVQEDGAPNQGLEDAAVNLGEAQEKLAHAVDPNTSAEERDADVTDATKKLTDTNKLLGDELAAGDKALSQEAVKAQQNAKDALEEVQEQEEATRENEEQKQAENEQDEDEPVDENQFDDAEPEVPVEL